MARLSGMDAAFLYLETPETPMHVAGLTLYELPEGFEGSFYEHFRSYFEPRIAHIPIFRKKLAQTPFGLHHPGWVDDSEFDIGNHLTQEVLPAPGTMAEVEALVARLHEKVLDRSRPLWHFVVIEGFANPRMAALYSKMHHAAVDGGAGMVVTRALYDLTPTPSDLGPAPDRAPEFETTPDFLGSIADLIVGGVRQQNAMLRAIPHVMGAIADVVVKQIPRDARIADVVPRVELANLPQFLAPKSIFNVSISGRRSYAARSFSLGMTKRVAKENGATLNDVVLAACGGALRRYLAERKALPARSLVAAVPVSLRAAGNTDLTNQVTIMATTIGTNIGDACERLHAVRVASSATKGFLSKIKDAIPQDYAFLGAPVIINSMARLFGRLKLANVAPPAVNVLISNVPGPPVALYCAGAKVTALYPVSIPAHGGALNVTIQSYLDHLDLAVTADAEVVPDAGHLVDLIVNEIGVLAAADTPEKPIVESAASTPAKRRAR